MATYSKCGKGKGSAGLVSSSRGPHTARTHPLQVSSPHLSAGGLCSLRQVFLRRRSGFQKLLIYTLLTYVQRGDKLSSVTPAAVIEGSFPAGLSHRSTPRLTTVFGGAGCYDWTSLRQGPAPAVTVAKELIRMRLSLQLHGVGSREEE